MGRNAAISCLKGGAYGYSTMSDDALQKHLETATNAYRLKTLAAWLVFLALLCVGVWWITDSVALAVMSFLVVGVGLGGGIYSEVNQENSEGEAANIRAEQRRRAEAKRLAEDPEYARMRAREDKVRASIREIEAYIESRVDEIEEGFSVAFPTRRGDEYLTVSKWEVYGGRHVHFGIPGVYFEFLGVSMLGEGTSLDEALVLAWPEVKKQIEQKISEQKERRERIDERIESFAI